MQCLFKLVNLPGFANGALEPYLPLIATLIFAETRNAFARLFAMSLQVQEQQLLSGEDSTLELHMTINPGPPWLNALIQLWTNEICEMFSPSRPFARAERTAATQGRLVMLLMEA